MGTTQHVGFRCKVCQNGFVAEVLTDPERDRRRREREPMGKLLCPRCGSDQVEKV